MIVSAAEENDYMKTKAISGLHGLQVIKFFERKYKNAPLPKKPQKIPNPCILIVITKKHHDRDSYIKLSPS